MSGLFEMAGGLPEGLVSNKKGVTTGIEEAIRLEAEDTLKLWRSMPSQPRLFPHKIANVALLLLRQSTHQAMRLLQRTWA